jgi:hypothetical protein
VEPLYWIILVSAIGASLSVLSLLLLNPIPAEPLSPIVILILSRILYPILYPIVYLILYPILFSILYLTLFLLNVLQDLKLMALVNFIENQGAKMSNSSSSWMNTNGQPGGKQNRERKRQRERNRERQRGRKREQILDL